MLPSSPFPARKGAELPRNVGNLAREPEPTRFDLSVGDSVGCYGHAATARAPRGGVACGLMSGCRGLRQLESAWRVIGQYQLDRGRIRWLSGIENHRRNLCTSLADERFQRRTTDGYRQPRGVYPCAEGPFDRPGARIHR